MWGWLWILGLGLVLRLLLVLAERSQLVGLCSWRQVRSGELRRVTCDLSYHAILPVNRVWTDMRTVGRTRIYPYCRGLLPCDESLHRDHLGRHGMPCPYQRILTDQRTPYPYGGILRTVGACSHRDELLEQDKSGRHGGLPLRTSNLRTQKGGWKIKLLCGHGVPQGEARRTVPIRWNPSYGGGLLPPR